MPQKKPPPDAGKTVQFIFPVGKNVLAGYQFMEGLGTNQKQVGGNTDEEILNNIKKLE